MNAPPADLVDNFMTNDAKVGLPAIGQQINAPEKKEVVTKGPGKENIL